MKLYKILSVLLEYPDQELIDHLDEIRAETKSSVGLDEPERSVILKFLDYLGNLPLTSLQADYVRTFDMTAEHSLHLTHHLFGDDKNRGPALIDLSELYKDYGVENASHELPDYLPLILEFATYLEDNEASVFLSDARKVLSVLADNLKKAESPYAPLLSVTRDRASLVKLAS